MVCKFARTIALGLGLMSVSVLCPGGHDSRMELRGVRTGLPAVLSEAR